MDAETPLKRTVSFSSTVINVSWPLVEPVLVVRGHSIIQRNHIMRCAAACVKSLDGAVAKALAEHERILARKTSVTPLFDVSVAPLA